MTRLWGALGVTIASLLLATSASAGILSSLHLVDGVPEYDAAKPGTWLEQIDQAKAYPETPYAPAPDMIAPYKNATLRPEVAFALAHGAPIARVEAARQLCQSIVDKLLAQWKGPLPQVQVVMTSEPEYGARANFTGDLFVHIGTFNSKPEFGATSVDELALLLGHELSHFLLMHQSRKQFYQHATDLLGTAASIYATSQLFSKSHMVGQNLQIAGNQQMFLDTVVGGLATTMLVGDVFSPSWGRDDEEEADMMGVDLARAAGYHIDDEQIQDFVEKHSDEEATKAARKERLKALTTLMILAAKTNKSTDQAGSALELLLKLGGAHVLGDFIDSLGGNEEHPDSKAREKHLEDYADSVAPAPVPGAKLVPVDAAGFARVANLGDVKKVVRSAITADQIFSVLTQYTTDQVKAQQTANTSTGISPVDGAMSSEKSAKKKIDDQVAKDQKAKPGKLAPKGTLPSACRGTMVALPAPPPAASGTITIDLRFPVDAAPFTWRVRGDWQKISPGCAAGAVEDYDHSAKTDFATLDLMHKIVVEYVDTNNAHRIPEIYERYTKLIGTDRDFPDLAVAAALIRHDQATAEVKAADCLVYDDASLWPTCVELLGYDPTDKATPAKTPEGQKAFTDKSLQRSFGQLLSLGGMFDN